MRRYRSSSWTDFVVGVALVIVLAGTFAGVLKVYQTADQAHQAICALREERVDGIKSAQRFLHKHPQGIPGISRADIQRSIETQKQTVRAFRFADC